MTSVRPTLEAVFRSEFGRLVAALAVSFGTEPAADAVQEAFIAAHRDWRRVSALEDPAAWIRRVALNRLLNGERNRRRRREILAAVTPRSKESLSVEELDVGAAVAALEGRERAVVALYYTMGLSMAEVAHALDTPEGTAKSLLHRARSKLRMQLQEGYGDERMAN